MGEVYFCLSILSIIHNRDLYLADTLGTASLSKLVLSYYLIKVQVASKARQVPPVLLQAL